MASATPLKIVSGEIQRFGSTDTVTLSNLGSGTPSSSTILLGDNTWSSIDWVNWSASLAQTGFSATTVLLSYYSVVGSTVSIWVDVTGTSNATTLTIALPFVLSANYGASAVVYPVTTLDSGTASVGRIALSASSATVTVTKSITGTAFTNSGSKAVRFFLVYEK